MFEAKQNIRLSALAEALNCLAAHLNISVNQSDVYMSYLNLVISINNVIVMQSICTT